MSYCRPDRPELSLRAEFGRSHRPHAFVCISRRRISFGAWRWRRRTDVAFHPPGVSGSVLRLREQLLRAHRLLGYAYAVRALNGARSALAAANRPVLGGHPLEVLTAQPELAVAVRIHDEPHQIACRQALGALAVTLAAHAAEIRPDFFEGGRQHLGIRIRIRLPHDPEVLLQLVGIGHAGDRGGDGGVLDHPLQRGGLPACRNRRSWRFAGPAAAPWPGHYLHGDQAHARLV